MLGRSDREILSHVRRALREIGEAQFTTAAYRAWRQRELARHDRPIPAIHQLEQRYGSFTEAVRIAQPTIPRRRLRLAGEARVAESRRIAGSRSSVPEMPSVAGDATRAGGEARRSAVELVAAMAESLAHDELRELERFLRRRLATTERPAAAQRARRLGALAQLLEQEPTRTKPFPLISRKTYDERRPADAPTSDTLQRTYGSWVKACRAAGGVKPDGRKAGAGRRSAPIRIGKEGKPRSYTREEVVAAIRSCADDAGRSLPDLSSSEYHEWQIERAARLRAHGQSHRLPNYRIITQLFGVDAEKAGTTIWTAVLAAAT
jgi:hypothetical protein